MSNKWIQSAIKHPGALHRELGVPQGEKIPMKKLNAAEENILATAQSKYGTGEAYTPDFPPMPTAMPQLGGDGLPAPYIQFIAGE